MTTPDAVNLPDRALGALRRLVGREDVEFRGGQLEAVESLVSDRARVLVVQRTGWGKSAVYFVATALRREQGAGPTIIVSPLLALMRDQIAAAGRAGVRAVTMNSANATEWDEVRAALDADEVDVLLVSPERLNNPRFRAEQLPELSRRCGLLVVDEAHCISDWGHDFRPDYRRIRTLLSELPQDTPVLATTATANERVVHDVVEQLSAGPSGRRHEVSTIRGGLARDSLRLGVLLGPEGRPLTPEQRLGWMTAHLSELPGSGIVYCLTVSAAEDVAAALSAAGHRVAAYTGRTDTDERERLETALRDNQVKALVATSALGMGFDKPDLGFVVHLGAPSSPVAYYQQVGRAGRATERADVVLLPGSEDRDIWRYFATVSMPRQEQADAVLTALAGAGKPLSTPALETLVDVRRTRLELLLKVLDVDGAVTKVPGGWTATGQQWTYDAERYARVAEAREREAALMEEYQAGAGCRMQFLQRTLDDPTAAVCGRCDTCAGTWFPTGVPQEAIDGARSQLGGTGVVIEPRAQWPSGMNRLGVEASGRIPAEEQLRPGRALARLSDLGWGQRLRQVLAADPPAEDDLVRAVVLLLADWDWAERPVGVVAMPSRRRPQLVGSLAERLSTIGRLPLLGTLDLVDGGPVGEPGGNSAFRLAGVWDRLAVGPELGGRLQGLSGPVLLVDDLVDSRWSLTVAGRALRRAGAPGVLPLALAVEG
ncbi:ATP-dependent DNA helicase RecQ [Kytococcus sedentarius]|uniref:DNA 3'-5' helicase n=2 Tax=Bacillati TaxID=1783272 RepID=C7NLS9_KYTSD|nr:RecQ family ATP-dependent DNA helicase [Kytococcus sedentarius]ACV05745.1 ATP-dependent DNA helicase RecQ [Kytococcus sedentarius DSM 20547]QQB64159.1 ATP-dependent DNA helicase RecQ [Kytococcus sedentarius]STX12842.1 ATP-dependent DNA helicase recQ [Kytococcus sedentarius]